MLARTDATILEEPLIKAIATRNIPLALRLIKDIQEYDPTPAKTLTAVDANGISFLSYSMTMQLPQVTMALFETDYFDSCEAVLKSSNAKQQMLLCQAAEMNYAVVIARLLKCKPCVYNKDKSGNTPLFYALSHGNVSLIKECVAFVIKQGVADVNHANNAGDTALHIILRTGSGNEVINDLLEAGADMGRLNKSRETPFGMLCQMDADKQTAWFAQLNPKNKIKLLDLYKNYLINHPQDEVIRKIYFNLTGMISLKDLAVAHLELDPAVKVRSHYLKELPDGFVLKLMYELVPPDEMIFEDTKKKEDVIYLYLQNDRVMFASRDENLKVVRIDITDDEYLRAEHLSPIKEALQDNARCGSLDIREISVLSNIAQFYGYNLLVPPYRTKLIKQPIDQVEDKELVKQLPLYLKRLSEKNILGFGADGAAIRATPEQLFTQDRNTLTNLIGDIENYLQDLSTRKPFDKYKLIAGLVPAIAWTVYVGLEIWLIVAAVREQNNPVTSYRGEELPIMNPPDDIDISQNQTVSYYKGTWCEPSGSYYYPRYYSTYKDGNKTIAYKYGYSYCDITSVYYWASIGFGILGGIGNAILSCVMPCCVGTKIPILTIPGAELKDQLEALEDSVIAKLEVLRDGDFPVDPASLNQMVSVIAELGEDNTRDEAIRLFARVRDLLKNMRDSLDKSHKPFSASLFAPIPDTREIVLDVPSLDSDSDDGSTYSDSDEEAKPLVGKNLTKRGQSRS